ncbi:ShlB/FhaC/HecB family hemolysin secretion/activation protein [Aphanothece sacrum]|uniref:ShlB/FhaC/HecB family hemolysin secretion/activation protein n=2 Tax=Aphanothece sacrum TaxID=1122 RepID=UPI001562CBC5|nr:ShlB/FhaC/HecB family hemolysin secretion/activation protein [Aphanothece sacrum]
MTKIWNLWFWYLSSHLLILLTLENLVIFSMDKILAQNPNPTRPQEQSIPFILPPKLPQPIRVPQPSLPTPLDIPPLTIPSPQEIPGVPGNITVFRFEFEGNTAFSDEELSSVTAPFTNKPIAFAQLLQAEAAITQLYTNAGYINSGAIIRAGQVFSPKGAVVKIQIIEGGVEEIQVTMKGRLNSDYVRSRLAIATTKPLNQYRLLEALQLLQLNPLIKTISADLSAGTRPELSILSVRVKEADSFNISLSGDNGRVPSIGSVERRTRLNQGNLLGFGDSLSVEYANTDGSNAVYVDYTFPVNPYNGTIKLTGRTTGTEVIEEPFNVLDIEGDSVYVDFSFRQPIIETPTQELALGVTVSRQESKTSVLGVGFPLSPGANDNGKTRLSVLRLFQEWTQRGSQDVLSVRSQFSFGIDAFDATINDGPPDGKFFEWQGQGQYVRSLATDTLLVLRSNLQLTSRPLVPLEQFTLGGLYSVRGYRQDLFLTDNGVFASAEVRLPVLRVDSVEGLLQVVPFVDFGVAWNDDDNPIATPAPNTLVGVGLGLQWLMGDNFTARFDWGIPVTNIETQGGRSPDEGFYFTINYSFF